MCGRFTLYADPSVLKARFALPEVPTLAPSWNIAPSQPIATVRQGEEGARRLVFCRWGLRPHWAREGARAPINVRAETVADKPTFRAAFRRQRCLVPASGYYEWRAGPEGKQPVYFRPVEDEILAFAGLWETRVREDGASALRTAAIITTAAGEDTRAVHDRMPAVLAPDLWDQWLDPAGEAGALRELLAPAPAGTLEGYPVGSAVNSPRNDSADLIKP